MMIMAQMNGFMKMHFFSSIFVPTNSQVPAQTPALQVVEKIGRIVFNVSAPDQLYQSALHPHKLEQN